MSPLAALALTVTVEAPLYVLALVVLRIARPAVAALLAVGVNLVTHPLLWYSLPLGSGLVQVAVAELTVCVAEAVLLWLALRSRAAVPGGDGAVLLLVSLGANATSVLIGVIVQIV